jgi:hypothetical protein
VRPAVLATVTGFAALTLTACANGHSAARSAPSPDHSRPATAGVSVSPPSTSPTPTGPTLPPAADGRNISACYDGSCEVEVRAPQKIPMSPKTGVATLTVTAVTSEGVQISGRLTNGNTTESTVFADPGSLAATTDGTIEIAALGVVNGLAVIRISPAN